MTLTIVDVEQGTDEWLEARRGLLTASVIGHFITPKTIKPADNDTSRAILRSLVAERITGRVEETWQSRDMLRGELDEPLARDAYATWANVPVEQTGLIIREEDGLRVGYSPDGLIWDEGLIEIKSRRQGRQLATILDDEVPAENMAQLQTGLWVTGRDWIDYVSYAGGTHLYVKRVHPDQKWQDAIETVAREFEAKAALIQARYTARTKDMPFTPHIDHFADEIQV